MRDLEQAAPGEKQNAPQGNAPQKAKPRGEGEHSQQHAARAEAGSHAAAHAEILGDERASHPANAEPLAELLSQLQHSHGNAYVQRVVSEAGGGKGQEAKPAAESQTRTAAQGLDAGTKSQMESAFGEDFGDVRLHTGKGAGDVARELGARAFTRGRDIYFNEGEYNPSTREGKELLAHELAHIVQQGGVAGAPQSSSTGCDGDAHEQEADRAAASVLSGESARVEKRSSTPGVQLQRPGGGGHPMGPITVELGEIRLTAGHMTIPLGASHALEVNVSSEGGVDRVRITVPDGLTSRARPISTRAVHLDSNPQGTRRRTIVASSRQNAEGPRILSLQVETQNRMYTMLLYFPGMPLPARPVVPAPPAGGGR